MIQQEVSRAIDEIISDAFDLRIDLASVSDGQWAFMVPFGDQHGDPLWFSIGCQNDEVTIDDGGAVAGLLFSLDQDEQGAPAYELLLSLARRHGLVVDYDLGLVRRSCPLDRVADTLPLFTRIVLALLTAAPHLEKKSRRQRSLGRRLRSRIRDHYKEMEVLHLVGRNGYMRGSAMHHWPTDFHWQMYAEESPHDVFVVAADLGTKDPIRKAERVSTLALDTISDRRNHDLRVVIDTQDLFRDEAFVAVNIIRQQGDYLDYKVFDYSDATDRTVFYAQAGKELLSVPADEWGVAFGRPSARLC